MPNCRWEALKLFEDVQLTVLPQTTGSDAAYNSPALDAEPWKVAADSSIGSWKLGSVPTAQIDLSDPSWRELESAGIVAIVGSSHDGGLCELAVNTSCLQHLSFFGLLPDLQCNPLSPDEHEIAAHGQHEAVKRARARFLRAAKAPAGSDSRGSDCPGRLLALRQRFP